MAVEYAEFALKCTPLFNEVFNELPVAGVSDFVASASFELRKALKHGEVMDYITVSRPDLPEWLQTNQPSWLGPYEETMLARLLFETRDISIVRGGTGSGKSSLIKIILRHTGEIASRQKWSEQFVVKSFVHCIDMQSAKDGIQRNDETSLEHDVEDLLKRFHNSLRASLRHLLPTPSTKALAALYTNAVWGNEGQEAGLGITTEVESVQHLLRDRLRMEREEWNECDPRRQVELFEGVVDGLADSHHRVVASLLPFVQLGRIHKAEGRTFLLLLDNLDPLPAPLQLSFYRTLRTFFVGPHTSDTGFRIVLFLRLSSAVDSINAYPDFTICAHGCPDPADVVFFRLSQFLLQPARYMAFTRLQPELQELALARLRRLWLALSEVTSPFSEMLSALAGTNIRNAFAYVKKWCLSSGLPLKQDSQRHSEFQATVLSPLLLTYICDEIGRAAVRGMRPHLSQQALHRNIQAYGASKYAALLGVKLCEIVVEVLRDTAFLSGSAKATAEHPRDHVSVAAAALAEAQLKENKGGFPPGDSVWSFQLQQLIQDVARYYGSCAPKSDDECADVNGFFGRLFGVFRQYIPKRCQWYANTRHFEVGELTRWKIEHLSTTAENALNQMPEQQPAPIQSILLQRRPLRRLNVLREDTRLGASRYQLARSLVDSGKEAEILVETPSADQLPPAAFNVFSVDARRICPAGLRILARLYDTTREPVQGSTASVMNIARLIEDFERHGYTRDDLQDALEEMVRPERRLVYSGISDWFDGVERLFGERNRHLRLTWAGVGYYHSLLNVPAFLQWSFQGIEEVEQQVLRSFGKSINPHQRSIEQRMEAAHIGFSVLIADEYQRLRAAWEKADSSVKNRCMYMLRHEPSNQSESLSLFFDTLEEFMRTLYSHAVRIRASSTRLDEVRQMATRWISDGQRWIHEHSEIFGGGRENPILLVWEYELDRAKHVLNRFPK
jgi:hypothetical protein